MKKLNFAFAGFRHGHIMALYTLAKTREDIAVVGAFEADGDAKAAAEKSGVVFPYDSLEALLHDPAVDVVAIGDYFAARGGVALRALRAGKHVLCDKPLCVSMEEAETIRAEAAERGLTVGVMLDLRTNPNVVTALAAVKSGTVGKVNNIVFEGQHPLMFGSRPGWYFEKGKYGGVINDIAVHGIDLSRLFTGSEVKRVVGAREWNFYADLAPDFKDSAQFIYEMETGAGVMGDVSYAAPTSQGYTHPSYWRYQVWGDKGMIEFSAVSDGVTAVLDGEEKPRRLADVKTERIWLDDFMNAVETGNREYTEDMLRTTIETLTVEAAAQ